MKKPGRNDPCPCGSGRKYKQCCLRAEENRLTNDRSDAVPRAIKWLMAMHGAAVREALDYGFFGSLDDDEYDRLPDQYDDAYEGIMINAMEWLLADGFVTVKGRKRRVVELLLGRGGPLFSAEQRQWIELLTVTPLRLYEIVDVIPDECMTLKDVMPPERLVRSGCRHSRCICQPGNLRPQRDARQFAARGGHGHAGSGATPPETMTELIEERIRQLYVDWADKPLPILDDRTPREAIQTPEGLKEVKFLLHTYEHGEARQANVQQRAPVSYDFLWQSLGISP